MRGSATTVEKRNCGKPGREGIYENERIFLALHREKYIKRGAVLPKDQLIERRRIAQQGGRKEGFLL